MILRSTPIKRTPLVKHKRKAKPGDDPNYLKWIRLLPCLGCFSPLYAEILKRQQTTDPKIAIVFPQIYHEARIISEAAHIGFSTSNRGLGQKYPDREAGPLCGTIHHSRQSKISIHTLGAERFFTALNLDRDGILQILNAVYEEGKWDRKNLR